MAQTKKIELKELSKALYKALHEYTEKETIPYFDQLDYYDPYVSYTKEHVVIPTQQPSDIWRVDFTHDTHHGGSEGVYGVIKISIRNDKGFDDVYNVLITKTLNEGENAYIDMNTLSARIVVFFRKNYETILTNLLQSK